MLNNRPDTAAPSVVRSPTGAVFQPTPEQREATTRIDTSLIVSASAGSGKTSVLAERCAYLTCDAPDNVRCDLTDLLVVTFTDAAAAQMRSRIRQTLRTRLSGPHGRRIDSHIQRQLQQIDAASISTLHSFCAGLLRQQFMRLDLDPNFSILDSDEADLLCIDSLRDVLQRRHRAADATTGALRELIEHYASGREETIADSVLTIYQFVRTLHDGASWLDGVVKRLEITDEQIAQSESKLLRQELGRFVEWLAMESRYIRNHAPAGGTYAENLEVASQRMIDWQKRATDSLETWEALRNEIATFDFSRAKPNRKLTDEQKQEKKEASDRYQQVKDLFDRRIRSRFSRFSAEQRREGLQQIRPYVETLVELIRDLDQTYAAAKRRRHGLDFNDLEQFTYQVLRTPDGKPSDVAKNLQNRYAHVLVDEFQDINPLQNAVLQLVSRESDTDRSNNLFCVGDLKQSIYRFRMADPEIFISRLAQSQHDASGDYTSAPLATNFRSVRPIIDGVNALFGQLMTASLAGLDYDASTALQCGRTDGPIDAPVEVHIVDRAEGRRPDDGGASDDEAEDEDSDDSLEDVEKQAMVIARRIEEFRREGTRYGQMAILLRAATIRAEQMAAMLQTLGIPTQAELRTGFFTAVEISDVLALLGVLDNFRQDIPLAAVMRSGVAGVRFDESEMLAIRRADVRRPFYVSVVLDARRETDRQDKIKSFLRTLSRFREWVGRKPLPEALALIYDETGYPAYVCGLRDGPRRYANLMRLLQRARQFVQFTGPRTLAEFLHFLERLRSQEEDLGVANPPAPSGPDEVGAVSIMTVHRSKGLQFPVVFVANLEKQFNVRDIGRRIAFDRHDGLAMAVSDSQRRIVYPSLVLHRITDRQMRQTLAEELRILYVAMTRAQDRLILVASRNLGQIQRDRRFWNHHSGPMSELQLLAARSSLDWVVPALARLSDDQTQWRSDPDESAQAGRIFRVDLHPQPDTRILHRAVDDTEKNRLEAVVQLEKLPASEPIYSAHPELTSLFDRLDFVYPHLLLGAVPAIVSVSELKDRLNVCFENDRSWMPSPQSGHRSTPNTRTPAEPKPRFSLEGGALTPADIGIATHVFLQHLDYTRPDGLAEQLEQLVRQGWVSDNEARHIDCDAIAWFLHTELGQRIIAAAPNLIREIPFSTKVSLREWDPAVTGSDPQDFIAVRGMIDLVVPNGTMFEIVDFKTGATESSPAERVRSVYGDQIRRYAEGLVKCWRCRVERGFVVLLTNRRIEEIPLGPVSSFPE